VHERPTVSVQGLERLVTVLLARNRLRLPTVAAGVPHAELAAELISLPSGLFAMVCDAIVKLKVRLRLLACAPVLAARAMGEGRRGPDACTAPIRVLLVLDLLLLLVVALMACSSGFRRGPVRDVESTC
jgi:hypothetical protein